MKSFRIDRSIVFLLIILFILSVAVFFLIFSMRTDSLKDSLLKDNLIKVLVVLEDSGVPISTNVVTYYPGSKRAAMFDIPGETGLIIRKLGRVDRIDALYIEKGVDEYRQEIQSLTGVPIPFYLVINLNHFSRLSDLFGGLEVFIPSPVDIQTDEGRILLPSGAVSLDGDKVKTYITYTDPLDQEGEAASRKQKAVLALFQALSDNSEKAFSKRVFPTVKSCMSTNIADNSLKDLLIELSRIDAERLVPQRVTGSQRYVDGKLLLFPFYDGQLLKDIVRQTLGGLVSEDSAAHERIYALEILNGTRSQGLAGSTSELYQSFGYDVIRVANAEVSDQEKTIVIDRIGNETVAETIAQVIQCTNIQKTSVENLDVDDYGTEATVDFTIILGKDFTGRYVR